MPSVQRVHDAFKDKDVVVLAISIDGGGEKAVKSFLSKHPYTFTTPVDARMETARQFGVRGLPTTYVINRQGAIVAHGFGSIDFDSPAFVQYLQALTAQPRG
jgi:peroxiredoxin